MTADAWWWSERRRGAVLGFTRRGRGASTGVHRGLNLGRHVEDDEGRVERNRATVLHEIAVLAGTGAATIEPVFMHQVHGAQVRVVSGAAERGGTHDSCDGIVTTRTQVALFALVADCTPVLLLDEEARVAAAVHAGRPGMLAGVVPAAVATMRQLGAQRIAAVVGPSVCGRCYEVPEQMRADAAVVEPVSAAVTWDGTPSIAVAAGVVEQLRREDVEVTWVPGCTKEDEELYSHRRHEVLPRHRRGDSRRPRGAGHGGEP
ncbi:MAG: polyphenol oxidase family protein [Intrasporangiaceae bacterium]|nr:polyphenol oxidase family protein [Intrasporangiaceae bacterium]